MQIEKGNERILYSDSTFTKRMIFNKEKVLNFMLNFKPGQELPPHTHEESDLILHVITGSGQLTVDGNVQNITEGDVVYCEGNEVFSMKNDSNDNLSCFVVIAPRPVPKIYSDEVK